MPRKRKVTCDCHTILFLIFGLVAGIGGGYIARDTIGRLFDQFKDIKTKIT